MSTANSIAHCGNVLRHSSWEAYVCSGVLPAGRPRAVYWALGALDAELFRARALPSTGSASQTLAARRARMLFWVDTLSNWRRLRDVGNPVVDAIKILANDRVASAAEAIAAAHWAHLSGDAARSIAVQRHILAAVLPEQEQGSTINAIGDSLDTVAVLRRALPLVLRGGDPGFGAALYSRHGVLPPPAPLDWESEAMRSLVQALLRSTSQMLDSVNGTIAAPPIQSAHVLLARRCIAHIERHGYNLVSAAPHLRRDLLLPVHLAVRKLVSAAR